MAIVDQPLQLLYRLRLLGRRGDIHNERDRLCHAFGGAIEECLVLRISEILDAAQNELAQHRRGRLACWALRLNFLQHSYHFLLAPHALGHPQLVIQRARIGSCANLRLLFYTEIAKPILCLLHEFFIAKPLTVLKRALQILFTILIVVGGKFLFKMCDLFRLQRQRQIGQFRQCLFKREPGALLDGIDIRQHLGVRGPAELQTLLRLRQQLGIIPQLSSAVPCKQAIDMRFDPWLLLTGKVNVAIQPPIHKRISTGIPDTQRTTPRQQADEQVKARFCVKGTVGLHDKILLHFLRSSMNIVILAAGMGKRMQSALPKVLHPLAGKPLLSHVIDTARTLSPSRLCVVYGHGGEAVPEAFESSDILFAKQEPQLGTGHAVMQAVPHLADDVPTLVLYGDVPLTTRNSLQQLLDSAGNDKLAILTVELNDPAGYGRIVRRDGSIVGIVEQKDASETEKAIREINTGIMVVSTPQLKKWLSTLSNNNAQKEYYLTDIVARAVADGVPVVSTRPSAIWETLGVNSKVQLAELERIHQRNVANALLEHGVTLADPARIDVRGTLSCGRDVSIDVNCVFEGKVELEDGVVIGAHCVIKNARIAKGTNIKPFCHVEDAVIGADAQIGPYARLRPGTELEEDVHIGNFVEVKNSQIAAHSKANHLAYVGDATVGSRVNIGAGTITCNYDGANKFRTIIEDDAFIGSDTQLVAPVRVGKGATLGAGTTLTKDAPEGKLTVSRSKQMTIEGWQRPVKVKK